jgi:2-dehydro-3-deoxy-D-arabinonate dehydratase
MLVRFYHPDHGIRLGVRVGERVADISAYYVSVGAWLRASVGRVAEAIHDLEQLANLTALVTYPTTLFDQPPARENPHWLAPVEEQDIWAAGVTYERSRAARQEEAIDGGDIYARVYSAERPELFFKAQGWRVIGPLGPVGIRADATWSVPEPELAVMINPALEVVGFAVGNDMSSRDIEGANPLYLPQAKVYNGSCALGPGVVLQAVSEWPQTGIHLKITRDNGVVFAGDVETGRIRRSCDDLINYLGRSNDFPDGAVLLTGTGIIPPGDFTLAAGDVVEITIDGIGTLINPVQVV